MESNAEIAERVLPCEMAHNDKNDETSCPCDTIEAHNACRYECKQMIIQALDSGELIPKNRLMTVDMLYDAIMSSKIDGLPLSPRLLAKALVGRVAVKEDVVLTKKEIKTALLSVHNWEDTKMSDQVNAIHSAMLKKQKKARKV